MRQDDVHGGRTVQGKYVTRGEGGMREDGQGKRGEFRFKRFSVLNEKSAMKVNTDGVILGAAMTLSGNERRLLDIGTGTGTVALMAAQRLSDKGSAFRITGIDIDEASAEEAEANFSRSPWAAELEAEKASLEDYAASLREGDSFDMIFSNPPYYGGELKAPDPRRCRARHSGSLSWMDIAEFAAGRLTQEGRLAMILPSDQTLHTVRFAAACGLYLCRELQIRTVRRKEPKRTVLEMTGRRQEEVRKETLVMTEGGTYTPGYRSLLADFLLIF